MILLFNDRFSLNRNVRKCSTFQLFIRSILLEMASSELATVILISFSFIQTEAARCSTMEWYLAPNNNFNINKIVR